MNVEIKEGPAETSVRNRSGGWDLIRLGLVVALVLAVVICLLISKISPPLK